ncbi:GntR family transcriptional regulator [Rhizobiales bacterium]|uniref:GntR family transcriptional regulator n=1 Tax=Hongsoonwoonella zoysiae TaxID=2821844 RepID=UPI001560A05B|nr:GntR family transcriptional regulator [Hongsoonwoonella zoysiae]NRG19935.1 GntR family transcriptional regulator [Hongsoonwoonella zoysiae]
MNIPVAEAERSDSLEATPSGRGSTRERVERSLRHALLTGRFVPGRPVTLRGLAQDLGVSPMPVREALRSLAAEKALDIKPNGRVQVPTMTPERLAELQQARLMLEPELALRAAAKLNPGDARALKEIDDAIDKSIDGGDAETYMRLNHAFHFHVYRAAGSEVLLPLVESLWLQFAPFMRIVYGRVGTAALEDHHKEAIAAVASGDGPALQSAIASDIRGGMKLLQGAGYEAVPDTNSTKD